MLAPTDGPVVPSSSIVRALFPHHEETAGEQPLSLAEGVELGHFKILERIRSGGMGAVFRALDTRLNRVVALKLLPPALSRDASAVQRFRNEAQAAAQLDHENIARVFYIGEDRGLHFIAFEFVTGINVRDRIWQQGQLQVTDAINYTLQIASALLHAAAQGVVHRDIKPSNIIITPQERAKLVDLGLARKEHREESAADLTIAGTTLGTFDYISPEQARDPRTADVRSDIYSLGCTLYHMLTGEPPYPEGTVLQKLLQHQGDEAPDPAQKNRQVPEMLSAIVRKMMSKDPRRRYQTAEQLVRDLMLVAGAMGLRSISPEGLIWMSAKPVGPSFWERHVAWIAPVAMLFVIVGYMEFSNSRDGQRGKEPGPANSAAIRNQEHGAVAKGGAPTVSPGETTAPEKVGPALSIGRDSSGNSAPSAATAPDDFPSVAARTPQPAGGGYGFTLGPEFGPEGAVITPQPLDRAVLTSPRETTGQANTNTATAPAESNNQGIQTASAATPVVERPERPPLPGPDPAVDQPISIAGADGTIQSYPTLEAACSAAVDGSIIVLRFNGVRREKPLRVTRKVTIRAGRGYHPVIEFVPEDIPAEGHQTRMITVASGALDLIGVELLLAVDDAVPADQWSLIAVQRPESLNLKGVTITVKNPRQRGVAVVEVQSSLVANMPEMDMGKGQMRIPLEIRVSGCLIRGGGDLFRVRNQEPARFLLEESVLALQGSLLAAIGGLEMPAENISLELRLDHVTAALGGNVLQLDSGDLPRRLLPVQFAVSNTVFTAKSSESLVSMSGNTSVQDFRSLLVWNGQRNFYDRFEAFWQINSLEGLGRMESLDFSAWQRTWGPANEVEPHHEPIAWKANWSTKPLTEVLASDFALNAESANNAAVAAATDDRDAGANLEALSRLGTAPASDAP